MRESDIQKLIEYEITQRGGIPFRCNVGDAWVGRAARTEGGGVYIPNARRFSTMLPSGFSDLFAVMPGGQAAFIEAKTLIGKVSPEQERFLARMREKGARAGVARCVIDAVHILTR